MAVGIKARLKINGGIAPNTGPEGLLCAVFGIAPKDIKYPPPRLLPLRGEVDSLPMRPTTQSFEEWLTGFWEGDGSMHPGGTVSIYQKSPQILMSIQEELEGGSLHPPTLSTGMWYLAFRRKQGEALREILSKDIVCPKRLEQLRPYYPGIELHKPTQNWFAGFWDADGHSHSGGHYWSVGVSQKDKYVLNAIRELWGFGRVYGYSWTVTKKKELPKVLELLLSISRNKMKRLKLLADVGMDPLIIND